MESDYHKNITKAIVEFAGELERFVDIGTGKEPLRIPHPTEKRSSIFYRPDVYFSTKSNKKYIFEILDSELKEQNLIIADAIQSFLVPNSFKVFFIMPPCDDETFDNVYDSVAVIWRTLVYITNKKYKLPRDVFLYEITKNDSRSIKKIKKQFKYFSKKDKW